MVQRKLSLALFFPSLNFASLVDFFVGYADDIAAARNTEEAQRKLRRDVLRTKT